MTGDCYDITPFYDENIALSNIQTNENNSDDKPKTIKTTTMTRYPFLIRSFISISSAGVAPSENH